MLFSILARDWASLVAEALGRGVAGGLEWDSESEDFNFEYESGLEVDAEREAPRFVVGGDEDVTDA